jgi:putative transcriptional regulator
MRTKRMKYIQTNLSYLRAVRKLTQRDVAQATGIGQKTLSALETGVSQGIEFGTLAKLCAFFRCEPSDILLIEEEEENTSPSQQALNKAEILIAQAQKRAMASQPQSPEELWAEFEAMREQLQKSVQQSNRLSEKKQKIVNA